MIPDLKHRRRYPDVHMRCPLARRRTPVPAKTLPNTRVGRVLASERTARSKNRHQNDGALQIGTGDVSLTGAGVRPRPSRALIAWCEQWVVPRSADTG